MLFWGGFEDATPHDSGKKMVCGHTSQTSGFPNDLGSAICIDTWVDGLGWLTCLDVTNGEIWQANQKGKKRQGYLSSTEFLIK
ncbi:hypothetical protein WJM97_04415 [Okeanomitos corallinicola TIOX110]|uniref:Serine/threonine protein phosphatase n=1 Tax=Okeanomitos corallinicola TIOX110 TaxID=3133117 RepID=A0ABZ2UVD4_9CYAN